jgi:adenylyl cyclase-associated protein
LGTTKSILCVILRLEAATSRLEDLADEQARRPSGAPSAPEERTPASYTQPAAAAPPLPPPPPPPPPAATMAEIPRSVVAFDETVIEGKLKPFLELTRSLGGECLIEQVS